MIKLSVVIPLGPKEIVAKSLLVDLSKLPTQTEIIFVTSSDIPPSYDNLLTHYNVHWISSPSGRANHLNKGAEAAAGQYLWFLHADSKFGGNTVSSLFQSIVDHPDSLLFFDLAFFDAPVLMFLNTWGAAFRSRTLKTPFGDQGFCVKKTIFSSLGGFPQGLPYGEDHIFVWRARQNGVPIQSTGSKLYTSARKYREHGWLRTTMLHQYLWIKQAWSEWRKKGVM